MEEKNNKSFKDRILEEMTVSYSNSLEKNFELAKKFKEFGGKKVIATIPLNDSDFGIKHLQEYIDFEVNGKKLIDETINTQTWYKENLTHCIYGDVILMLGNSLGTMGELSFVGYFPLKSFYFLLKLFFFL